jgi:hemolysin activation/secretion protein
MPHHKGFRVSGQNRRRSFTEVKHGFAISKVSILFSTVLGFNEMLFGLGRVPLPSLIGFFVAASVWTVSWTVQAAVTGEVCPSPSSDTPPADKPAAPEPLASEPASGRTFDILNFAVIGNTLLSEAEIGEAVYPYLGENKADKDICAARDALVAVYGKHGYSSVGVAPETRVENGGLTLAVEDGVVKLTVIEQKVSRLRVVGAKYSDIDALKAQAPAVAEGKVPDFNAFGEELKQLNQPNRAVTPRLQQGREPNTIEVELDVDDKLPITASVEINNRYSANTKPYRLSAAASYDNLFQLGHSLAVNYVTAPQNRDDAEVFSASYTAPIGRGDFSLQFSGLTSGSNIASLGNVDVIGRGYQVGFRTLWRAPTLIDKDGVTFLNTLSVGFDFKDFDQNVLTGGVQAPAPLQYVPITASWQATLQENEPGSDKTTAESHGVFTLVHNFAPASSTRSEFDNRRFDARGDFTVFRAEIDREQTLFDDFKLYGALGGQVADSPLINSESFVLGGYDSVRGYLESELLSDEGGRASIEFRSLDLVGLFDIDRDVVREARLIAFLDGAAGLIYEPLAGQKGAFALASTGIGTRMNLAWHLHGSIDFAWALLDGVQTRPGDMRSLFRVWADFP